MVKVGSIFTTAELGDFSPKVSERKIKVLVGLSRFWSDSCISGVSEVRVVFITINLVHLVFDCHMNSMDSA